MLTRWFGVDRSTITWAISEVRLLRAERECAIGPVDCHSVRTVANLTRLAR
ncbi:hypothetical protein [Streptomyces cellulosae]|uniref:hypothetical protein n=1 Tax=Streptomyces cellulosae TaxID=1968 RepID=UPI001F271907|nr:hypothetical protein [Streptomyces cellulosae]